MADGKKQQSVHKRPKFRVEKDDVWFPGAMRLKVKGKDLDNIPKELFSMHDLAILDLSPDRQSCLSYRLTYLPTDIGRMVNLKVLMLDTNELTELPSQIGLLNNLQRLSISNNKLSILPDGFERLQNLNSLHMVNNNFESFPMSILELPELEYLDISDNMLSDIPEDIKQLHNLENLMLFMNKLTSLPDGICDLVNLKSLWIGDNQIRQLPRRFANLIHLNWGEGYTSSSAVDGNPLKHPPVDICKLGIVSIARYFDRMEQSNGDVTAEEN